MDWTVAAVLCLDLEAYHLLFGLSTIGCVECRVWRMRTLLFLFGFLRFDGLYNLVAGQRLVLLVVFAGGLWYSGLSWGCNLLQWLSSFVQVICFLVLEHLLFGRKILTIWRTCKNHMTSDWTLLATTTYRISRWADLLQNDVVDRRKSKRD